MLEPVPKCTVYALTLWKQHGCSIKFLCDSSFSPFVEIQNLCQRLKVKKQKQLDFTCCKNRKLATRRGSASFEKVHKFVFGLCNHVWVWNYFGQRNSRVLLWKYELSQGFQQNRFAVIQKWVSQNQFYIGATLKTRCSEGF